METTDKDIGAVLDDLGATFDQVEELFRAGPCAPAAVPIEGTGFTLGWEKVDAAWRLVAWMSIANASGAHLQHLPLSQQAPHVRVAAVASVPLLRKAVETSYKRISDSAVKALVQLREFVQEAQAKAQIAAGIASATHIDPEGIITKQGSGSFIVVVDGWSDELNEAWRQMGSPLCLKGCGRPLRPCQPGADPVYSGVYPCKCDQQEGA